MCRTTLHKSGTCIHSWFSIVHNCTKDKNFSNCSTFTDRKYRRLALSGPFSHEMNQCPECNLENKYDGNQIRMVEATETSWSKIADVRQEVKDRKVICKEVVMLQNAKALEEEPACCVM